MKKRPCVGVSVILVDNQNILLGLRKGSHGSGSWGMPGGHIEWRESFFDCAKREVKEELGVSIICNDIFFSTNDYFKNEDKHYVTIFIVAKIQKGLIQNKEPHKCAEWKWFNHAELPLNLFLPVMNLIKQKSLKELLTN